MTLREYKDTHKGNIKLGAKSGAAFIWCGDTEDLDFDKLEKEFLSKTFELMTTAGRAVEFQKSIPLDEKTYEAMNRGKKKSFEDWVRGIQKEIERRERYYARLQKRIETYGHFGDREVMSVYPSTIEPDTEIVLIEGGECGRVWTTAEYKKGAANGQRCRSNA